MTYEAMKLALEAMEYADACLKKQLTTKTKHEYAQDLLMNAGTALRQAIAEAEKQEPVSWMWEDGTITADPDRADGTWTPLYTSPPKREWQGLTDDEVSKLIDNEIGFNSCCGWEEEYTRAVEAKLKEKNGL